jgi:hypothetical protein
MFFFKQNVTKFWNFADWKWFSTLHNWHWQFLFHSKKLYWVFIIKNTIHTILLIYLIGFLSAASLASTLASKEPPSPQLACSPSSWVFVVVTVDYSVTASDPRLSPLWPVNLLSGRPWVRPLVCRRVACSWRSSCRSCPGVLCQGGRKT